MARARKTITILNVEVDAITIDAAISNIIKRSRRNGAVIVTKPYVEFFRDDYSDMLNQSWLCLPDGVALQWAAYYQTTSGSLWQWCKTLAEIVLRPKQLRRVLPERFAGTNFTWPLIAAAAKSGRSIYLVGSPQGSDITTTAHVLQTAFPNLIIAGTMPGRDETGGFSHELEAKLAREVIATTPDIILIGLGFPLQEELMQRLAPRLKRGVLIGEGGTFDYQQFGGQRPKAPRLIQRLGLEWLWRLLLEPKRWRRQLAIPQFMWRMFRFTNR